MRLKCKFESVKNGINDVDVIYCAAKQAFRANIKRPIDDDVCVENKSLRFFFIECRSCDIPQTHFLLSHFMCSSLRIILSNSTRSHGDFKIVLLL